MERLYQYNYEIRQKIARFSDELESMYPGNFASHCLNMIYNESTICLELISYYYDIWGRMSSDGMNEAEIEETRKQNQERCISATRNTFISAVSCIEYSIRKMIDSTPNHVLKDYVNRSSNTYEAFLEVYNELLPEEKSKLNKVKRMLKALPPNDPIYKIILMSKNKELIDETEFLEWEFILNLRNITVHNNCIATKDICMNLDECQIIMEKGKQVTSTNLCCFLKCVDKAMSLFYRWTINNFEITKNTEEN